MHIDCPGCGTSYHIPKAALEAGRRVACPRCDAIWIVSPQAVRADSDAPRGVAAPKLVDAVAAAPSRKTPSRKKPSHTTAARGAHQRSPLAAPAWLVIACASIGLSMGLIGWRAEIVRRVPQTASVYSWLGLPVNLRGLALAHFRATAATEGRQNVLDVAGEITNMRNRSVTVPAIRIAIRNSAGRVLYSWVMPSQKRRLAANEAIGFHARLGAPPAEGHDVLVDFAPSDRLLTAGWRSAAR